MAQLSLNLMDDPAPYIRVKDDVTVCTFANFFWGRGGFFYGYTAKDVKVANYFQGIVELASFFHLIPSPVNKPSDPLAYEMGDWSREPLEIYVAESTFVGPRVI